MVTKTPEQPGCGPKVRAVVQCTPFWFVGPGSNFSPVLQLADLRGHFLASGEDVMEALRLGLVDCAPKEGGPIIQTGGYEGMPDIEITHRYWRTTADDWLLMPPTEPVNPGTASNTDPHPNTGSSAIKSASQPLIQAHRVHSCNGASKG